MSEFSEREYWASLGLILMDDDPNTDLFAKWGIDPTPTTDDPNWIEKFMS